MISTAALTLTLAVIGTGAAGAANAATPTTTVTASTHLVQPSLRKMNVVSPLINKWD